MSTRLVRTSAPFIVAARFLPFLNTYKFVQHTICIALYIRRVLHYSINLLLILKLLLQGLLPYAACCLCSQGCLRDGLCSSQGRGVVAKLYLVLRLAPCGHVAAIYGPSTGQQRVN